MIYGELNMSIWFEGSIEIESNIQKVKNKLDNLGEHYVSIISLMPGMTSVELVEHSKDIVVIRTNEGIMKRTNISVLFEDESIVVEFDEEYQAGSKIKTKSHFFEKFLTCDTGINHQTVNSNVEAPGILGFFYRKFGSSNIGNAFLKSYKTYFEEKNL